MDFLKWWWWHVLDNDTREGIVLILFTLSIVAIAIFLVGTHMAFYPWIFCVDIFLAVTIPIAYGCWYVPKQHKTWQELEEEEEEGDV